LSFRELATQNDYLGSYLDNVKLVAGSGGPAARVANHAAANGFAAHGDHVMGTEKSERLKGTSDSDHIMGQGGNDRITGFGGNDSIDGGTGIDTVVVAARPKELKISLNSDGDYVVKTKTQTLLLEDVEKLALQGGVKSFGTHKIDALQKALATAVDADHKKANLLGNASFEKFGAALPKDDKHLAVSDADMTGWASSKGVFKVWQDGYNKQPASHGRTLVEVNAQHGAISQDVDTQAGHIYELSFDFKGQTGRVATSDVEVLWNGAVILTLDPKDAKFHDYALYVTGTGGDDTLTFRAVKGDTDSHGGLLDNVNLHDFALSVL
jgi:hypothetical protein